MRTRTSTVIWFVLALVTSSGPVSVWAQTAEIDAVHVAEEEMRQAILNQDVEQLAALWNERFMVNAPRNVVVPDREAVLNVFREGIAAYSIYEQEIEHTRAEGNIAIVMGRETVIPKGDAAPHVGQTVERRYTHVWEATQDGWQLIARHAHITNVE